MPFYTAFEGFVIKVADIPEDQVFTIYAFAVVKKIAQLTTRTP